MLIDKIRVNVRAGDGGHGAVYFYPNGKPAGGNGGDGGNVYVEGSQHIYDLTSIQNQYEYIAEYGEPGGSNKLEGKNGADVVIKVPLVTTIYDAESKIIATVEEHGQKILIATGGRGGLGNHHFRKGQVATLNKHTRGKKGEEIKGFFELKLAADVVFIGFPNAGKSSAINSITNANVKVAAYPFTTLQPHLGVTSDGVILMDLPGLIEGTAEGKGLGTRFNKHTERAKLVAHFVSLESEDIKGDYMKMRKELENIDQDLVEKTEIIILTKSDLLLDEEVETKVEMMKEFGKEVIAISTFHNNNVDIMLSKFRELTY